MKLLILNGPNINLLGLREPGIYGTQDYATLLELIDTTCAQCQVEYRHVQSNYEGELVTEIQQAYGVYDAIVINPAAYTHTSVAILDALKAVGLPVCEVHISHVDQREDFRRFSYVSLYAQKVIKGQGIQGYAQAIRYFAKGEEA